jgi:gliding motility-associated-like protein
MKKSLLIILTLIISHHAFSQIIRDFGDAPETYGSADHIIDGTSRFLGLKPDAEAAQLYSPEADGDDRSGSDDEDGVTFPDMIQGTRVTVRIDIVGSGRLNGWIDWNSDGDFDDINEKVANNISRTTGAYNLTVNVPADAIASRPLFARFRYGPNGLASTGSATYGEVEDYIVKIICAQVSQPGVIAITQPSCAVPSGSVVLDGLPSAGTWILTRMPGAVITTGTGTGTTISGLEPGTWTYTVTNESGCTSAPSENITILPVPGSPAAPVIDLTVQPTCTVATGSINLSGLPEKGTWILTRYPDLVSDKGTGTTTTVPGLAAGTYYFTVANEEGCVSPGSDNTVINIQPVTPAVPEIDTIIQPTCNVSTGSVILTGLPPAGTWTVTRYPGGTTFSGSGISTTISGLQQGTYYFTVTNSDGCTSSPTPNVVINQQPLTPTAPVPGAITHPTCQVPGGTVVLNGLPPSGTWTLTRLPGSITTTGSGTSTIVAGLESGIYNFYVINEAGCPSAVSVNVIINPRPGPVPAVHITNPGPVCSPATVDITNPAIVDGSTQGLIYSYWQDIAGSIPYNTPATATAGTYYIKGTTTSGCSDIQPVIVTVLLPPAAAAGPDQVLEYQFSTALDAEAPGENLTGEWSVMSGSGHFADANNEKTTVRDLAVGENILQWTVDNGVCPPAADDLSITVHDLLIPTLITPNNDGLNDYFFLQGLEFLGKTVITVVDRRGVLVFENNDYDNLWDGVDYNGNPLPDDTYFFILEPENRTPVNGYIVIRR